MNKRGKQFATLFRFLSPGGSSSSSVALFSRRLKIGAAIDWLCKISPEDTSIARADSRGYNETAFPRSSKLKSALAFDGAQRGLEGASRGASRRGPHRVLSLRGLASNNRFLEYRYRGRRRSPRYARHTGPVLSPRGPRCSLFVRRIVTFNK